MSIESFAIVMMMSIVELKGKWIVVLAFHPSDEFPTTMGVAAST